jgi:hypothetical protein
MWRREACRAEPETKAAAGALIRKCDSQSQLTLHAGLIAAGLPSCECAPLRLTSLRGPWVALVAGCAPSAPTAVSREALPWPRCGPYCNLTSLLKP